MKKRSREEVKTLLLNVLDGMTEELGDGSTEQVCPACHGRGSIGGPRRVVDSDGIPGIDANADRIKCVNCDGTGKWNRARRARAELP